MDEKWDINRELHEGKLLIYFKEISKWLSSDIFNLFKYLAGTIKNVILGFLRSLCATSSYFPEGIQCSW